MRTCLATVIYKQAQPYLQDLLDSVDNQSDKDFDLLIINDNYTSEELAQLPLPENTVLVDLSSKHPSIVETRIEILKVAKKSGYDLAVLIDADDMASVNRIEAYKKAAELDKTSVFFYNKFVTDKGENVFKTLPKSVTDIKQISQQNFLGLSNTGIRLEALSEEFIDSLQECVSPVFDWYLFSRILMDIGQGGLVDGTATIYRIYEDNIAGSSRDLNKELDIKTRHYQLLSQRYEYFNKLAKMLRAIDKDSLKLSINHQGYWWSDIQMEE